MNQFQDSQINFQALKQKAYNLRWAEVDDGVIPLTAADSDFPVSPAVTQAIQDYIADGYFSYTPKRGMPAFNEIIATSLLRRKREVVNPKWVLPLDSAARGMSVIASAYLQPGDEAIVFDPVDFLFETSMSQAGATIVKYPMKVVDGKIDFSDLESYITPKTKMLGLCNPHNPLGKLYPLEDLEHIAKLSEKYGFYIMNDEIWSDIVYSDATFNSILHLGEALNQRTLTVSGLSKSYGVAGMRIGYIIAPNQETYDVLVKESNVDTTIGGIASLSQVVGMACMDQCDDWQDAYVAHLEGNRDYACERLANIPGLVSYKPHATFVLFVDVSSFGMSAEDFANYVRQEHKLAIVPGGQKYFGAGSEGYVRICLATGREVLAEGLNRLEQACLQLQK